LKKLEKKLKYYLASGSSRCTSFPLWTLKVKYNIIRLLWGKIHLWLILYYIIVQILKICTLFSFFILWQISNFLGNSYHLIDFCFGDEYFKIKCQNSDPMACKTEEVNNWCIIPIYSFGLWILKNKMQLTGSPGFPFSPGGPPVPGKPYKESSLCYAITSNIAYSKPISARH
jgi:hypothetical protein